MRIFRRSLLISVFLSSAALARGDEPRPSRPHGRIYAAHGVTPGGLLFVVTPASRRLSLRTLLGTEVGSYPMQPDERLVVGVADDGSRVTSGSRGEAPSDDGLTEGAPARFSFRDPAGNVTSQRAVPLRHDSTPAVFGTEVFSMAREKEQYVLLRTSASETGTRMGRVDVARLAKEVGRLHRISIHASAAGVIVEFVGAMSPLYFDPAGAGRFVRPDASLACGEGEFDRVFPAIDGGVGRLSNRYENSSTGFHRRGDVEWLDRNGGLVRSADLGEIREVLPLAAGRLLILDEAEVRVLDDRGGELSRAAFSTDEGVDPGQAARAVAAAKRMERLGEKGAGSDWVEVALAASGEAYNFAGVARRDPAGVLSRFAQVPDTSPDLAAARVGLGAFLMTRGFENAGAPEARIDAARSASAAQKRWDEVIRNIEELIQGVDPVDRRAAPRWFTRQASFAVLAARGRSAPAWISLAAAEAITAGETAGVSTLPEGAFTPELAELTLALDRDRMERFEREHPEVSGDASWSLRVMDSDLDREALRFHLPARRFAASILSCLPGAGPIRFEAVVESLGTLAAESRAADRAGQAGLEDEGASSLVFPGGHPESKVVELGPIAALLLDASRSEDADLRAGAQLLFPLFGIALDARRWREDVLRRGDLMLPVACLLMDRSLSPESFTALFSEALLAARSASRDPQACALNGFVTRLSDDEETGEWEDPYCRLLAGAIRYGPELSEEVSGRPDAGRSREIAAWTRSSSAPSEIRLHARIARVQSGSATESDRLELWDEKDLPWGVRRIALFAQREAGPSPALAAEWSRELRGPRRLPAEESALLAALQAVDPTEAARIALERWESGEVAMGTQGDQVAVWVKALDATRIASDPKLHATLKRSLNDEGMGPEIAAALARAGDADALPPLLLAVRTGCLT